MSEENEIRSEGLYSPEVLAFVKAANEYCSWLEDEEMATGRTFIVEALRILSQVYHSVLFLDENEPALEGGNEKFVTEQDWSRIYQNVLNILGTHNTYLRIAENDEFDRSDLVDHSISEDLADIYQDLKNFTSQYRQGIEEIMNDALWELIDNFDNYWSVKLLNALGALNKLLINKTELDNDQLDLSELEDDSIPKYDNSFFTRHQDEMEEDS